MAAYTPIEKSDDINDEIVVNGHLRIQNDIWQMVFTWHGGGLEKGRIQKSTGLKIKDNKRKAEILLNNKSLELLDNLKSKSKALKQSKALENAFSVKSIQSIQMKNFDLDMLFSDYLTIWHQRDRGKIDDVTWASYGCILNIVKPYFQELGITVGGLTDVDLEDFYKLQSCLGKSNTTVHKYHVVIHKALGYLYKKHILMGNPADLADHPVPNNHIGRHLTVPELQEVVTGLAEDLIEFPVYCAGYYGLRRSEIVGLSWQNFNLYDDIFTIRRVVNEYSLDGKQIIEVKDKTKNKTSSRSLPIIPPFKQMLLRIKTRQEEYRRLCRNSYNTKYLDFICVNPLGDLIHPSYITDHFSNYIEKNGPKIITFHELRHTCASILYANNVDLKHIQLWLGHSTLQTTADIYSHFIRDPFDGPKNVLLNSWTNQ